MNPNIEKALSTDNSLASQSSAKQLEQSSREQLEMQLTHRIEHYSCMFHNSKLEGKTESVRAYRQIIEGLANQYYVAFKRPYSSRRNK